MINTIKVGICSGYFACGLHEGYLDLFNGILCECDYLIVIINNDKQTEKKYGFVPISAEKRQQLIEKYPGVHKVYISIDEDESVALTLSQIAKDVIKMNRTFPNVRMAFYNSGDRTTANINKREQIVCQNWLISMEYLNMPKVASSSELIEKISIFYISKYLNYWGES